MIFLDRPDEFDPKFEIVSCFVECSGKILVMQRNNNKPQGETWCKPAGKVEVGEALSDAMKRELEEEAGIVAEKKSIKFLKTVYVQYTEYQFLFHMFRLRQLQLPIVSLNLDEHTAFHWVTPQEALNLNLIEDEDECIKMVYFD